MQTFGAPEKPKRLVAVGKNTQRNQHSPGKSSTPVRMMEREKFGGGKKMETAHDKKAHPSSTALLLLFGHVWPVMEPAHWHLLMFSLQIQAKDEKSFAGSSCVLTRSQMHRNAEAISKVLKVKRWNLPNVNPSQSPDLSMVELCSTKGRESRQPAPDENGWKSITGGARFYYHNKTKRTTDIAMILIAKQMKRSHSR